MSLGDFCTSKATSMKQCTEIGEFKHKNEAAIYSEISTAIQYIHLTRSFDDISELVGISRKTLNRFLYSGNITEASKSVLNKWYLRYKSDSTTAMQLEEIDKHIKLVEEFRLKEKEILSAILYLYNRNSFDQIARSIGISRDTLRRFLNSNNINENSQMLLVVWYRRQKASSPPVTVESPTTSKKDDTTNENDICSSPSTQSSDKSSIDCIVDGFEFYSFDNSQRLKEEFLDRKNNRSSRCDNKRAALQTLDMNLRPHNDKRSQSTSHNLGN